MLGVWLSGRSLCRRAGGAKGGGGFEASEVVWGVDEGFEAGFGGGGADVGGGGEGFFEAEGVVFSAESGRGWASRGVRKGVWGGRGGGCRLEAGEGGMVNGRFGCEVRGDSSW